MNLAKNKTLNIIINILLIVILPLALGALMAMYIEVLIAAIVFVPGLIAFFAQALSNGANMGDRN